MYGGDYADEDEFEIPLVATYEPDKAQRFIRLCKRKDKLHDLRVHALQLFDNKYRADNPRPEMDYSVLKERVRWPSGLKQSEITQEMRDERNAIEAHNRAAWDAHAVLTQAWEEKFEAARIAFLLAAKVPKKKHHNLMHGSHYKKRSENRKYKIKELKVI
jgi:hypothetical protein